MVLFYLFYLFILFIIIHFLNLFFYLLIYSLVKNFTLVFLDSIRNILHYVWNHLIIIIAVKNEILVDHLIKGYKISIYLISNFGVIVIIFMFIDFIDFYSYFQFI
jgi:hypothetical protein